VKALAFREVAIYRPQLKLQIVGAGDEVGYLVFLSSRQKLDYLEDTSVAAQDSIYSLGRR